MLTNLTSTQAVIPSHRILPNANQTVASLVRQAEETHSKANRVKITPKQDERSVLSTCQKSLSVQCLEGTAPTHLQSPLGAMFTGKNELYVPNAWGDAIYVSQKDLDVMCAEDFEKITEFLHTQINNGTISLEDMRKHYGGGDVFCASEPFEDSFIRDSFKNEQPAKFVIVNNTITPECPEDTFKIFKAPSIPWDLTSGFRRTEEDENENAPHRNLKKSKSAGKASGDCVLPQAQCDDLLIPAHKRVIPLTIFINALGKSLDVYYVPNSLGQTIQTNENDVGVSCVRDLSELQQDYKEIKGFTPNFEQIRDDMGGGEIVCTNKAPDDKLYPTAFVVKSPASYEIEKSENNTDVIVPKCPEGTNPVFITNPEPATFGEADTGNKIKMILIGTIVSIGSIATIGGCAYQIHKTCKDLN